MGQTHPEGPDEFEPSKFDSICFNSLCVIITIMSEDNFSNICLCTLLDSQKKKDF